MKKTATEQQLIDKIIEGSNYINSYWGTPPVMLESQLTEDEKQAVVKFAQDRNKPFEFFDFDSLHIISVDGKKNYCRACSNQKHGVKSRKSFPHTCGR